MAEMPPEWTTKAAERIVGFFCHRPEERDRRLKQAQLYLARIILAEHDAAENGA